MCQNSKSRFHGVELTSSFIEREAMNIIWISKLSKVLSIALLALFAFQVPAQASPFDDLVKSVTKVLPSNPFDIEGSTFNKLIDAEEYDKALGYFTEQYPIYFDKRFNVEKKEITPQLQKLGRWVLEKNYKEAVTETIFRLQAIKDLSTNANDNWKNGTEAIARAIKTALEINSNDLLRTSKISDEATDLITSELAHVYDVAKRDRQNAIATTFDDVIQSGRASGAYPRDAFTDADYKRSSAFQARVAETISKSGTDQQGEVLRRLEAVTATDTATKLTRSFELKRRLLQLGRGPYPLEKLGEIRAIVKEFGAESGLQNAVKIGYVDLTATSFKNRNIFDFELEFVKDYGLALEDAQESFLGKSTTTGYDYLFVTDLSAAKILREFKNKREIPSAAGRILPARRVPPNLGATGGPKA